MDTRIDGVPIALIINAKQSAVEGEDERATDEEVQTADVAVGEGHPDPSLRAGRRRQVAHCPRRCQTERPIQRT